MNDLEQRLRSALDARARTFEASPDAWQRVREREPRRSRARWVLAALPVALLAVFVPILLTGGLGRNSAADGADDIYRRLMADRTPAGESVTLDDPAGGKLRLWFARGEMGQPVLCYIAERAQPYGACDGMIDTMSTRSGWFEGSTARDGASRVMDYGVARQGVERVGAVTKSGKKISGTLLRPQGAPFLLWTVTYAAQDPVSKAVFTEPGRTDYEMPRSTLTMRSRDDQPAGKTIEVAGGLTVGPYKTKYGRALVWLRQGKHAGSVSLEPQYLLKDAPVHLFPAGDRAYGAARKDIAQIQLSVAGERETTAATRSDPWGLGIVLFAIDAQEGLDAGYRLTAYDAAGKEVWHKDWAPRQRTQPNYGTQIGGTMTVPSTENFGYGPVRLRFVKERPSNVKSAYNYMICTSGGVGPEGDENGGCGAATFDDLNGFSHGTVHSFLPEPGTTISYGSARPDWESVDAVLKDGTRIHGSFLSAPGAPARAWYVKYPYGTQIAAHVFKVKGRQLEQVWHTRHDCWGAKPSQGRPHALTRGITALLHVNNCLLFAKGSKRLPGYSEPVPGGKLRDILAAEHPLEWVQHKTDWYGFTLPGTARVEVALKGGGTATADTVPDPWGQGVLLFAGAVPEKAGKPGISWPGLRFTGYDAAGQVVWTYKPRSPLD
ncbi:hypothetical protein ACTMTI_41830 [Nonomuraea sp. H19]|uniref:hypothetical protein n=1 Tax=Nonomuraea sp. H19 TaxID=3452206 RepID=UPI003F8967F4